MNVLKSVVALLIISAGSVGLGHAQNQAVPAKKVAYFDENRLLLPSAEQAAYREETTYRDSVSATVREYYPSGKVRRITPYAHLEAGLIHGLVTSWYEDGKMRARDGYLGGKRQGELLTYYPDGTLRRRDTYEAGKRTAGECFGPDGKAVAYTEYEQLPEYPGGSMAMLQSFARSIRYPSDALRAQRQGQVLVSFLVATDGTVRNAFILKGVMPSMDQEALRVVRELKKFAPGLEEGVPVPVQYTVPINFAIR